MAEESKCKWCGRPIKSGEYCLRHKNPEPAPDPPEPPKVKELAATLAKRIATLALCTHEGCNTIDILRCNIERLGTEAIIKALRPYFPPASQTPPISEHVLNEIVLAICEIPDRTSPDDFPEAMIVTPEELRFIIRDKFEQAAIPASTARTDGSKVSNEDFDKWQTDNWNMTADRDTYQMIRCIAVDFTNSLVAPGSVPQAPVAANTPCSEHKVFQPACAGCWKEYYKSPAFCVPQAEPQKEEKL